MKKLLFILLFLLPASLCMAATTQIGSPWAVATVQTAINAASDGDTIELTGSGSAAWNSQISIPSTKGITLRVSGGTNGDWNEARTERENTNFPITITTTLTSVSLILITCNSGNSLSRVTGFKFQNTGTLGGVWSAVGVISIRGAGDSAFRVDNNYLDNISAGQMITVFNSSDSRLTGVIDNNTLHDCYYATDPPYGPYGVQVFRLYPTGSGNCAGGAGWTDDFTYGDEHFVFVEDNLIENTAEYTLGQVTTFRYMRHMIEGEMGASFVARYNTLNMSVPQPNAEGQLSGGHGEPIDVHGLCLCTGSGHGFRGAEIYNNKFLGTDIGNAIVPRGGSWLIYDNEFDGTLDGEYVLWREFRARPTVCASTCSSLCPCVDGYHQCATDDPDYYPLPEQIADTYLWGNTDDDTPITSTVDPSNYVPHYIQEARDYFESDDLADAKVDGLDAGYTPYTYPHPLTGGSASPSGTVVVEGGITESDVVTGGKALVITLSDDTWVATVGADNAITTALIAGIDSNKSEATGWDAVVKANMVYTDVARTSDTVVTITLGEEATYDITASETIEVTIPATAVASEVEIVATPTFIISVDTPASSGHAIGYSATGHGAAYNASGHTVTSE